MAVQRFEVVAKQIRERGATFNWCVEDSLRVRDEGDSCVEIFMSNAAKSISHPSAVSKYGSSFYIYSCQQTFEVNC